MFKDKPYELWRTSDVNANGQPTFNLGTQAHAWASALLGRTLGVEDRFSVSELRNKRMSAQIVWMPKKTKPSEKSATLGVLRHVPVNALAPTAARPAPSQISADANSDDIDKALAVAKFEKKLERAKKKKLPRLAQFQAAYETFDTATRDEIETVTESLDDALDALDD